MTTEKLSPEERSFCVLYAELGDFAQAAACAGYRGKSGLAKAALLLQDERAIQFIKRRYGQKPDDRFHLLAGLKRLALGVPCADVQQLLDRENGEKTSFPLSDLFGVSELKYDGNRLEVKFYDRLRALELLHEILTQQGGEEKSRSFYDALEQGAAALRQESQITDDLSDIQ